MSEEMRQYAPYPTILADLVAKLRYRSGWVFDLRDMERDPANTHGGSAGGLTFVGLTGVYQWMVGKPLFNEVGAGLLTLEKCWWWSPEQVAKAQESGDYKYAGAYDAYRPGVERPVYFYFSVPAATYNEASWTRWLFDSILDVEIHEAMEHFALKDDELLYRPHPPTHGPGDNPYTVHDYATDIQRDTNFRGVVKESLDT